MARRMARYEHRESSGQGRSGQAANRNRHHPHHHHQLPADAQPQITAQHHGEQRCQMLTELTEQTELPERGVCWLVDLPWGWLRKRLLRLSQRLWLADASRQRNPAC